MLAIPYGWRFSLLYRAPLRAGRFCGVSFGPRPGARPALRSRHAPFASPVLYRSRAVRPRGPCPFFIIPQTRPATCPGRAKAPGGNGHSPPSEACLPGDPAVTWAACVSGVGMGAFLVPEPGALHGLRSAGGGGVRATARNGGEAEAGCLAGPGRPGVRTLERFRRAGSAGRVHGGGRGPAGEYQQRRGGGVPEGSV